MPSLTEIDIIQSSNSSSYLCFPEANNSSQYFFQSLCDQEGSWDCQSNLCPYDSTSEFLLLEEASHFKSENPLLQQHSLQSYNTYVVDYIENSIFGKYQSYNPFACSFSKISRKEELDFVLMVEEGPLCVFQTQISPEVLHEHTNPPLLVKNKNDEQHCNCSQHIEITTVCSEGLNRREEDKDSKWDVSSCFSKA